MKPTPTSDHVEAVERRIEARRAELARRYDEVREGLQLVAAKSARSWPLVLLGGSLVAGYAMSRGPRRPPALQYATAAPVTMQGTRPVTYALPTEHDSHWMRKAAGILGLTATAIRIATSGEARALFGACKSFRARRR